MPVLHDHVKALRENFDARKKAQAQIKDAWRDARLSKLKTELSDAVFNPSLSDNVGAIKAKILEREEEIRESLKVIEQQILELEAEEILIREEVSYLTRGERSGKKFGF